MENNIYIHPVKQGIAMPSCAFKVVYEIGTRLIDEWPDDPEQKTIWRAAIPVLPHARAWGYTQKEAFGKLKKVADLIINDLQERGQEIPLDAPLQVGDEPFTKNIRKNNAQRLSSDHVHLVTGKWATKTIHIDGELVTVGMLRDYVRDEEEARTDEYNDYLNAWGLRLWESAEVFDWGSRSDGARLLSIAWIFWFGGIDLHDWIFLREIEALPRADFTYRYPRSRLKRDLDQGGDEFAADFQRGMKEMGGIEIDPREMRDL
jgi:predicted RNase H-like HicB family nuclease